MSAVDCLVGNAFETARCGHYDLVFGSLAMKIGWKEVSGVHLMGETGCVTKICLVAWE